MSLLLLPPLLLPSSPLLRLTTCLATPGTLPLQELRSFFSF